MIEILDRHILGLTQQDALDLAHQFNLMGVGHIIHHDKAGTDVQLDALSGRRAAKARRILDDAARLGERRLLDAEEVSR